MKQNSLWCVKKGIVNEEWSSIDYTALAYLQTFKIACFNVLLLSSSSTTTYDIIHKTDSWLIICSLLLYLKLSEVFYIFGILFILRLSLLPIILEGMAVLLYYTLKSFLLASCLFKAFS